MHTVKKSFTLIELIVAASILSIGIVLVLRSFLSSAGALNLIADRLEALQILETRMGGLKEEAAADALKPVSSADEIALKGRKAICNLQVTVLQPEDPEQSLREAKISLVWDEDGKDQEEILATYLENRKSP